MGEDSLPNGFHTVTEFNFEFEYADGSKIHLSNHYHREEDDIDFPNGILFEGDEGRIFVNRERLTGKPVEELTEADNKELTSGRPALRRQGADGAIWRTFSNCVKSRGTPISDVDIASSHDDVLPLVQYLADARPRAEVGPAERSSSSATSRRRC